MQVAFLNDTSSWYHWGCTGTSTAIVEAVEKRGHTVRSVPIRQLYAWLARNREALPRTAADFDNSERFKRFLREHPSITQPIVESDLLLVNGEGSLHQLSPLSALILYLANAAKKFCGKNVQIINHSCYPDGANADPRRPAVAVYRSVYRLLDYVAIREHRSLELMKALGMEKATLSFDSLPLYIRDHPPPGATKKKSIVVAGSVAWRAAGIPALSGYMQAMAKEGFEVTVLTGAKADPAVDDIRFVAALRAAAPEGWTHLDAVSMESWLTTIQNAGLLLSGRFHYTIAACMLDTPAVILDSNTPKNVALAEMAGLPLPQGYEADNLGTLLRQRTDAALGHPPISDDIKRDWQARAERNFSALPG